MARCKGMKDDGRPCGAPDSLVDNSGYCPAHREDGKDRMHELARKGAEAMRRKFREGGLDERELPPFLC